MIDLRILDSQKKRTFELLQASGLNPADFEWDEIPTGEGLSGWACVSEVRYLPNSHYFFRFDYYKEDHDHDDGFEKVQRSVYRPGKDMRYVEVNHDRSGDHFDDVGGWVTYLKLELEAEDYLNAIIESPSVQQLVAAQEDDDTFTDEEIQSLEERLDGIHQQLLESGNILREHVESTNREFENLKNELGRSSRMSWIRLAIGAFLGIAGSHLVSVDAGRSFFENALTAIVDVINETLVLPFRKLID